MALKAIDAFDAYEEYLHTADDDSTQVYRKSEADREIRRQKRKRCLAMARYYEEEVRDSIGYMSRCGGGYDAYVNARIDKMKKRLKTWRELADKLKE